MIWKPVAIKLLVVKLIPLKLLGNILLTMLWKAN